MSFGTRLVLILLAPVCAAWLTAFPPVGYNTRAALDSKRSAVHHFRNPSSSQATPLGTQGESGLGPCGISQLKVVAGQLVGFRMDHGDIPLSLSVRSPEGSLLHEPSVSKASVFFFMVAPTSGVYLIELRDKRTGDPVTPSRCRSLANRRSKPQDAKLIDASKLITDGGNDANKETAADLRTADQKLAAAMDLLTRLDQSDWPVMELLTAALTLRGRALNDLNSSQEARPYLERALKIIRRTRDKPDESFILVELGRCYFALGNISQASQSLGAAAAAAESSSDVYARGVSAKVLADFYYELNDYQKALQFAREGISVFEHLPERRDYAHGLITLGQVESDLNNSDRARNSYAQAISISREINYQAGLVDALTFSGHLSAKEGHLQDAIESYAEAEALAQRLGDKLKESWVTSGLAYVYDQIGDANRSFQYYQRTLDLRLAAHNLPAEASIYRKLGAVSFSLKDYSQALSHFEKAVRLYEGFKQWRFLANTLRDLGQVQEALGEYDKASNYYDRATQFVAKAQDTRGLAYLIVAKGRLSERKGDFDQALHYYRDGLKLHRTATDPRGESETLFNLGHLLAKRGQLDSARTYFEESIRTDEKFRTLMQGPDVRASYLADIRKHYESYIDLLMQLHQSSPHSEYALRALEFSERARARSFLESLTEASVNIRQGVDPALLNRERALQKELDAKADLKMRQDTDEALDNEIRQLTAEYEEIEGRIRAKSPRYARLSQPQPLKLQEIQQRLLDDNTLLLEYMLGDERSYVWAVTPSEVSSYELPGRAKIEESARGLYKLLSVQRPKPGETLEQRLAPAREAETQLPLQIASLSQVLLGPVADQLGTKRLLIVADGALQYIPFQVLTVPGKADPARSVAGAKGEEQIPLAVNHEIVNEPSASTLALVLSESANRKPAPKSVAILADPVFDVADSRIKLPNAGSLQAAASAPATSEVTRALRDVGVDGGQIPRLLSSREEADVIMSLVPWRTGLKIVGFDANRTTAMGSGLGQYRIVHFATHALLDNEHPELSGIVLSLVDQNGQPQDGFLRLHDIYNLKLPVDMVVLSACQTGLGKDVKGEGLIGLTRGFMYAGASGVVASLWKVDDEATAELMKHFYEGLFDKGLSPSDALRKAQLAMRVQKRWQEPYYWAGFVIQGQYAGQGHTSYQPSPAMKVAVLGSVGMALFMTLILVLRRRRMKSR